jgi:hypothetical protein
MDKRETVSKLNKKTKRCVHKKTKDNDNHFSQSSYQDTLTSKGNHITLLIYISIQFK